MKIGGASLAEDCMRIESVLKLLGPGQRLAVDANGRFDLKTAIACAKALSPYNLFWYDEMGDPLDYTLQAKLANHYQNPMATEENLFSMPHLHRRSAGCARLAPRRLPNWSKDIFQN